MAVIHLDGATYEVSGADNLLHACLSLGLDIPYFCWHPSLGSVGSCRQCAVKQYANAEDAAAGKGRIVMSCMVETTSDLYISIDDDEAEAFRESITELLMTNHPHDCPTCEEGGHCHLQDMTYMTHHDRRAYRFTKRTHHNQELGVFINHEMNRCIACYRCVRYYDDYAGGTDLGVYASANRVYFGRAESGTLESEFAGNLTEICPTGVFTDKTHSDHYTRKWDMQYAPSICQGCAVGCNISVGERYGEVRRVENRYNHAVNGYFLCDAGRFGYDVVNGASLHGGARPEKVLINGMAGDVDAAIDHVAELIGAANQDGNTAANKQVADKTIVGIGSSRASLEANHALKTLVGADNFSTGVRAVEQALVAQCVDVFLDSNLHTPTLQDIEAADCVLILGEDITNTAPRVALAVRQAAKNKAKVMTDSRNTPTWLAEPRARIGQHDKSPIYILDTHVTRLDDVAAVSTVSTPEKIADFAKAVAKLIAAPKDEKYAASNDDEQSLVNRVADGLAQAKNPLIIAGASLGSSDIITAAQGLAGALTTASEASAAKTVTDSQADELNVSLKANTDIDEDNTAKGNNSAEADKNPTKDPVKSSLYLVAPAVNSVGVQQLGGMPLDDVLAMSSIDVLFVAENDLSYQLSNLELNQLFKKVKKLVVLDSISLPWHDKADVLLPAASYAQSDGTCVSAEGRAQRYFQVYEPSYYRPDTQVVESWRWLHAIATQLVGHRVSWQVLDDVVSDICSAYPALSGIKDAAPNDDYRISGLKVAREPRRYSGRTAMRAPVSVHEPKQPVDADTALTYSMEGYVGEQTQAAIIPFAWAPGWNSPQSWNKFQKEVGGPLKQGDVGVRLFDGLAGVASEANKADANDTQAVPDAQVSSEQVQSGMFTTADGIHLLPMYDLFSSGELARQSKVLSERSSAKVQAGGITTYGDAFVCSLGTAAKLGVGMGADDALSIIIDNDVITLPVRIVDYAPADTVGYPKGVLPALSALLYGLGKGSPHDGNTTTKANIQLKASLPVAVNS